VSVCVREFLHTKYGLNPSWLTTVLCCDKFINCYFVDLIQFDVLGKMFAVRVPP
jgi:hypothetical protein